MVVLSEFVRFHGVLMGGFFKPLRRKIGVVTLGVACVLVAGWVRGFFVVDAVAFANTEATMTLIASSPSRIGWSTIGRPFQGRLVEWQSVPAQPHDYGEPVESPDVTLSSYGEFYFLSTN